MDMQTTASKVFASNVCKDIVDRRKLPAAILFPRVSVIHKPRYLPSAEYLVLDRVITAENRIHATEEHQAYISCTIRKAFTSSNGRFPSVNPLEASGLEL
jgi:hypothetical protein